MDKLGPMARTAEDCGLVLAAVAGSDPEDPSAQLTGRAQSEATLLEIGMQFQTRTTFHRQRPPGL